MKPLVIAGAAILLAYCVLTHQRNETWRDAIRLQEDMVRKSPDKPRTALNLGTLYWTHNRPNDALRVFFHVLDLCRRGVPGTSGFGVSLCDAAMSNMASIYINYGDLTRGRMLAEMAHRGSPKLNDATINLAVVDIRENRFTEAFDLLDALPRGRDNPSVEVNRSEALRGLGRCAEAQEGYRIFKAWNPGYAIPECGRTA